MKSLARLAFSGAVLVLGCGGGTGPATPPFNPFGTDPSGNSSEPSGSSDEAPPGGGQSLGDLCASVCARFATACPTTTSASCAASCTMDATKYPNCVPELEAFVACAETATISCSSSGSATISGCTNSETAFVNCAQASTTTLSGSAL